MRLRLRLAARPRTRSAAAHHRQGGLPEKPGLSSEAFLKLCKRSGIRWAITCRDATHTWYHRGLAEGGSFDSVLNDLQAEINLVQPREVVCIGSSMGGYAAIRAGLYLKASAIIAYSPQVLLSTSDRLAAMILPMPHLDPYLLKMHLAAELEDFRPVTLIQAVEQCPGFDATVQVRACARACARHFSSSVCVWRCRACMPPTPTLTPPFSPTIPGPHGRARRALRP